MAQTLADIENDALRLSEEERARLAVRLLASLEEEAESPEEIETLWVAEAEQRYRELRDGVVQGIPASEFSLGFGPSCRDDRDRVPPVGSGGTRCLNRSVDS